MRSPNATSAHRSRCTALEPLWDCSGTALLVVVNAIFKRDFCTPLTIYRSGTALGTLWDRSGTALGPRWDRSGTSLLVVVNAIFKRNFRTPLTMYRSGTALGPLWARSETALLVVVDAIFKRDFRTLLTIYRSGTALGWLWDRSLNSPSLNTSFSSRNSNTSEVDNVERPLL